MLQDIVMHRKELLACAVIMLLLLTGCRASQAIIEVNSDQDVIAADGTCTLREAVLVIETGKRLADLPGECVDGANVIHILPPLNRTIVLRNGPLYLTRSVKIIGPGSHKLSLLGDGTASLWVAAGGEVEISGLTFRQSGNALVNTTTLKLIDVAFIDNVSTDKHGILDNYGQLTISRSRFIHNRAVRGAGISNHGGLSISESVFENNIAVLYGGAIFNDADATATIHHVQFQKNNGGYGGGAIYNRGVLKIETSSFVNQTASAGGAVWNSGQLSVTNTTFVDNTALGIEGGGALYNLAQANIRFGTFCINRAQTGNAILQRGTLMMRASLFAGNTSAAGASDIIGTVLSEGYNLFQGTQTGLQATDRVVAELPTYPASYYADSTVTCPPKEPAQDVFNSIPAQECNAPADQRGVPRPQGQRCDIGAFEQADHEDGR